MGNVTRVGISPFAAEQHIGVYRSFLVSVFVAQYFKGKTYLRIDDTNPQHKANLDELVDNLTYIIDSNYFATFDQNTLGVREVGSSMTPAIVETARLPLYCEYVQLLAKGHWLIDDGDAVYFNVDRYIKMHGKQLPVPYCGKKQRTVNIETVLEKGKFPLLVSNKKRALWHLTTVVDDISLGVSHVVRACDKIDNQVAQVILYNCFEQEVPEYFYTKTLVGEPIPPTVRSLLDQGISIQAIRSYLYGTITGRPERLYLSFDEAIKDFVPTSIKPGQIQYDFDKLLSIQRRLPYKTP